MKKSDLLQFFGSALKFASRLDYASRNSFYNLPDILTDRQRGDVIRRMKAKRITVPKEWMK